MQILKSKEEMHQRQWMMPSKKKVDPINEIQVAVVLEECDLYINFLIAPCLDKLVTKNYRERIESHDAACLEVLPSSGEMASEEEVEKGRSLTSYNHDDSHPQ